MRTAGYIVAAVLTVVSQLDDAGPWWILLGVAVALAIVLVVLCV